MYCVTTDLPSESFLLSSMVSGMNSAASLAIVSSILRCCTELNAVVISDVGVRSGKAVETEMCDAMKE